MIKKIKLGADPELFLEDIKGSGLVSAEGKIGGTKEHPAPVPGYKGYFMQEDNVMVEFNIPPADSLGAFKESIEFMLEHITGVAMINRCKVNQGASGEFDYKYLLTEQAMEFGCDPDFNVYTQLSNEAPDATGNLRTCGGHIHIGYDSPNTEDSANLIKAMDMTLGLQSLELDKDTERRKMYGNAGAFRFKKYGVEYRTLSNFWIFDSELIKWAYAGTMAAIELVNTGAVHILYDMYGADVKKAIDSNNKEAAATLKNNILNTIKTLKLKKVCVES